MHPVLEYPHRSPFKVAEALRDIIKDKVVCDVGCACGDIMIEFSKYCKRVVGIEKLEEEKRIARSRGLEVLDELPDADIYYVWAGINTLDFLFQFKGKKGKLILAEEDMIPQLGGYLMEIPIDDVSKIPNNDRKTFHLQILDL